MRGVAKTSYRLLRRAPPAVLGLFAILTGILWVDSYVPRKGEFPAAFYKAASIDFSIKPGLFPVRDRPGWHKCFYDLETHWPPDRQTVYHIESSRGTLTLRRDIQTESIILGSIAQTRFLGVEYEESNTIYGCSTNAQYPRHPSYRTLSLTMPFWMLFVVFAAYPATVLSITIARRRVVRRRRERGQCLHCGYNLRGNESGTCPECGLLAMQKR